METFKAIVMAPVAVACGVVAAVVVFMFMAGICTLFVQMGAVLQGDSRCSARGYHRSEVVVHYPTFWSVDTYCYDGQQKESVKL